MASILDEIKTAGTPLALSFYNLFAKIDSLESGAPDFKALGGYLMTLINAYLSIDLSRSELENQRALDVVSDNILVPLTSRLSKCGDQRRRSRPRGRESLKKKGGPVLFGSAVSAARESESPGSGYADDQDVPDVLLGWGENHMN
jgi:hypothetical protein